MSGPAMVQSLAVQASIPESGCKPVVVRLLPVQHLNKRISPVFLLRQARNHIEQMTIATTKL
jgi:hypothetical protein